MKKDIKTLNEIPWTPSVGDKWQHACHPNVYDCQCLPDGTIGVVPRDGSKAFTVKDLETLKLPNMGRD